MWADAFNLEPLVCMPRTDHCQRICSVGVLAVEGYDKERCMATNFFHIKLCILEVSFYRTYTH